MSSARKRAAKAAARRTQDLVLESRGTSSRMMILKDGRQNDVGVDISFKTVVSHARDTALLFLLVCGLLLAGTSLFATEGYPGVKLKLISHSYGKHDERIVSDKYDGMHL